ncbi:transcriptional regulator [Polymorphobacter multimanifer]|uniref:Methylated-DNA--protein-cysteine methyltransferase n=1 Tax=Polymorphobacter multimanifer TaxID=1070431 RepID=A0A841LBX3_9SPHN|nr:bifunctional transcriptional activator/DNA repair protein Ada [Polymorphobacter multimanifer]MBB6229191.1 AraC family transcriptional regulator of adaptative response/methylated-DNA-[protein]-cysteine methyltransferase [Polymorphobacter multimanifer]GGI69697.1 transcriptional regulator [Polymorphobacter multimanifer]
MDLPPPDVCHAAIGRRDPAFDGLFYTCVRTTGIYCRPVCPARPPLLKNCSFVRAAAEAEAAGFRACKRCRPDAGPGTPAASGSKASVTRALRILEAPAADAPPLPRLAERLGLSERHLRRLFARHLGVSPVALAQASKLARAVELLDRTEMPMAAVAAEAGFTSVRRFNELFLAVHNETPRQRRSRRPSAMHLTLSRFETPFATLLIVTTASGAVAALDFSDFEERLRRLLTRHHGPVTLVSGDTPPAVAEALAAYLAGDLSALQRIPTAAAGTAFQQRVWAALCAIPPGQTRSYAQIAEAIGQPGAARAVGMANGQNPIGIIVPCHRVIGASGSLTGYAGGMARKAWLLAHEGAALQLV